MHTHTQTELKVMTTPALSKPLSVLATNRCTIKNDVVKLAVFIYRLLFIGQGIGFRVVDFL